MGRGVQGRFEPGWVAAALPGGEGPGVGGPLAHPLVLILGEEPPTSHTSGCTPPPLPPSSFGGTT